MTTRCKFTCRSKTTTGGGDNQAKEYKFSPVTSGSKENKEFWKWTPTGELTLSSLNPNVNFEPGKDYYLDISEVET